ncbi:MAG: hypothetical protein JST24_07935 [Acidobacteria bacterium]|nr:hypothetical protein [Acidobacteriota bacterium]
MGRKRRHHEPPLVGYLTTEDAATYLGISARYLEDLRGVEGGPEGPPFSRMGDKKAILYPIWGLDAWVNGRLQTRNSQRPGEAAVLPPPESEE